MTLSTAQRSTSPWVLLPCLASLAWVAFWFMHARHYWEDDAYIHLEYARSVFEGRGFMFNGLISNGDTSPVWVLLLAGSFAIVRDWMVAGKALTIASTAFALWMTWRFTRRLEADTHTGIPSNQAPWLLALFVVSPYFCYWAFSGMEAVGAAGMLMALAMLLVPQRPDAVTFFLAAFVMGLGPLIRPEMVLMFAAGGPFLLRQWWQITQDRSPAAKALYFLVAALLLALPLGLWSAYALQAFGYVMPNTNAAKRAAPTDVIPARLLQVFGLGFPGVLLGLTLMLPATTLAFFRSAAPRPARAMDRILQAMPMVSWPIVLWSLITVLFYIANHTYVQTRYVTVMAPALMCVLWVALSRLTRPWVSRSVTALTMLLGLLSSSLMAYPHVRNKVEGDQRITELATYIQQHLPADAKIAVYSIGQLGYMLKNPLIDIGGITRPEASKFLFSGSDQMLKWAKNEGATYFIAGEAPEPTATLLTEIPTREVGWFPRLTQYEVIKPLRLWKLQTQHPPSD